MVLVQVGNTTVMLCYCYYASPTWHAIVLLYVTITMLSLLSLTCPSVGLSSNALYYYHAFITSESDLP